MREELPKRRAAETFEIDFGGYRATHRVTLGYYKDGRLGEVFIDGGKSGEGIEAIARDGAVLLSIALQYGADIETIGHALTRDSQGQPSTVIGAVVDCLTQRSTS